MFCFILLSLLIYFLFLSPSNESLKRNENFVEMTIPKVIDGKKLSNNKKHQAPCNPIFADKAGHIVNANQVSIVEYIKNRISIKQRPLEIKKCERFGDLEVDLIIGKNHEQAIVTINDRASGMLKMKKIPSKEAKVVQKTITELLED